MPTESSETTPERFNACNARLKRLMIHLGGAAMTKESSPETVTSVNLENMGSLIDTLDDTVTVDDEKLQPLLDIVHSSSIHYAEDEVIHPNISDDVVDRRIALVKSLQSKPGAGKHLWSVDLPVRGAISAPGLTSWRDGRPFGRKQGRVSREVIHDYSMLDPKSAPPIKEVMLYLAPDGSSFWQLIGDGAHRLAGAKLREARGQEPVAISAYNVTLNILKEPVTL